jgi:hypothetical protein
MKLKSILGSIIVFLGTGAAQAASSSDLWLHIKVNDHSEGSKVDVTLPLALIQASMPLLPREARTATGLSVNSSEISLPELRRAWKDLMRSSDATFVRVQGADGNVQIAKRGDYLVIHTDGHHSHDDAETGHSRHEQVDMKMPLRVVEALLTGDGERFNVAAAIDALAEMGEGELVTVNGDHETVRMWVDHSSGSR